MNVVVCVPYRGGEPTRDRNWAHVQSWWQEAFRPGQIIQADSGPGVFNRSRARNIAARRAGPWDVAIFADADTVGTPKSIRRAAQIAHETSGAVWPFDSFEALSEVSTDRWLNGARGGGLKVLKRREVTPGGIVVVSRPAFGAVGGWDEGFSGWGYEDVAFATAIETLVPFWRIEGRIVHLWHPYDETRQRKSASYLANRKRRELYRAAEGDTVLMRSLLDDLAVKVEVPDPRYDPARRHLNDEW